MINVLMLAERTWRPMFGRAKTSMKGTHATFLKFCLVGGAAFVLDALVLQSLVTFLALGPVYARIVSFFCAATFTWILNRKYTFDAATKPSLREFAMYLGLMWVGVTVNWLVFLAVLAVLPLSREIPVIALVPATATALLLNFFSAQRFIYRPGDR